MPNGVYPDIVQTVLEKGPHIDDIFVKIKMRVFSHDSASQGMTLPLWQKL